MAPGACLNSWLRGRVCAGEAREGLEGVLLRALARSIGQMLRCHELRVEARGPARPGPARLQHTPRSGAPHGARLASKDLNPVVCPGPHGKTADCTARACARADGAASSAPSLLPAPVAAASAGAAPVARRHVPRAIVDAEQRALEK